MPIVAVAPEPEPFVPAVLPKPELAVPQPGDDLLQAIIMAAALLALAVFFIVSARRQYPSTTFINAVSKSMTLEEKQEVLTLSKQKKASEKIEKIDTRKLAAELAETQKAINKFKKKIS